MAFHYNAAAQHQGVSAEMRSPIASGEHDAAFALPIVIGGNENRN